MKKIISVILILSIIFSAISVSAFAVQDDFSFAVASDIHYNAPRESLEYVINDSIYWYANRRCAMEDESGYIFDEFLNQCAENDKIKFVLIPGDLCDNGRTLTEDHRVMAKKLYDFEQKTGKQVYVINGNHDAAENSNTTYKIFKEIYKDFGYSQALSARENDCSYTVDLDGKYRLIALDSNDPEKSTEDGITKDKIKWVKAECEKAKADNKYPILMMHHNLLDHMPLQRIISRNFIIRFHYTTAELFANWGIKLVLSGHEHCSDATSYTSTKGNKIYDFANTSLTMYPLAYRVFTLNDEKIIYENKTVEKIDYVALQNNTKGFTSEQISLMQKGLNSYAKGFLKAGIKYRLQLQLTMEKMGITQDKFYYNIIKLVADRLNEILEMPMDDLAKAALKYGIVFPENSYSNGWDLASEIMASHYNGEEAYDLSSPEISTLLKTVVFILRDELPLAADSTLLKFANEILAKNNLSPIACTLTQKCTEIFGAYSDFDYAIMTILGPFCYAFAFDSDNVNDNNGIIESYGNNDNFSNIILNIKDLFSILNEYIKIISYYVKQIGG